MPVVNAKLSPPVAEAEEFEHEVMEAAAGGKIVVVVSGDVSGRIHSDVLTPGHGWEVRTDVRTLNVPVSGWEARIEAAQPPSPFCAVIFIGESAAPDWERFDYDHPLIAERRISGIVRRGQLPTFEWDY